MQVTLVAYYGEKPTYLFDFLRLFQQKLSEHLHSNFYPYDIEQVHATIIGLEGIRNDDDLINKNFYELRNERRLMNFAQIMQFIDTTSILPINFQIGGFRHYCKYPFVSRGEHPYLRSFSIRGNIAVAMGWPVKQDEDSDSFQNLRHHTRQSEPFHEMDYPKAFYQLRKEFETVNVLHKWHKTPKSVDNDFYFVLGRIDQDSLPDIHAQNVEESMRLFLAGIDPIVIPVDKEHLSLVGYLDTQLPIQTSCRITLDKARVNPGRIHKLYPKGADIIN